MKVFLDTNVLVSAFATRGLCADVMRVILTEHELLIGEVVLTELQRILSKKFQMPEKAVVNTLNFLKHQPIIPKPEKVTDADIEDKDDLWILASALKGQADILVTGDHELLALKEYQGLTILSPRAFWKLLAQESHS